jgi:hypothetical protein
MPQTPMPRRPCLCMPMPLQQLPPTDYESMLRQAGEACKTAIADGHKIIEVDFPPTSLWGVTGDGEGQKRGEGELPLGWVGKRQGFRGALNPQSQRFSYKCAFAPLPPCNTGQNEMNACMKYLRQFLNSFREEAASTRVFFPDNKELAVAVSGQTMDPNAGRLTTGLPRGVPLPWSMPGGLRELVYVRAGRMAMDPTFGDTKFKLGYLTKQSATFLVSTVSRPPAGRELGGGLA